MNLLIKTSIGETYSIDTLPESDVGSLKTIIGKYNNIIPSMIQIMIGNKQLDNSDTFISIGVKEGDTLFCNFDQHNNNDYKKKIVSPCEENKGEKKYHSDPIDFSEQLKFLENMGFPHKMVKCALRSTFYDVNSSLRMLLGQTEEDIFYEMEEQINEEIKSVKIEKKEKHLTDESEDYSIDSGEDFSSNEDSFSMQSGITRKRGDGRKRVRTPGGPREGMHWSHEQDELLLVKWLEYGSDWNKILAYFPDRTKPAVSLHWNAHLRDIYLKEKRITMDDINRRSNMRFTTLGGRKRRHSGRRGRGRSRGGGNDRESERITASERGNQFVVSSKWSKDDDDLLIDLYEQLGEDWDEIANHYPDKRKSTISQHWKHTLEPQYLSSKKEVEENYNEPKTSISTRHRRVIGD